MKITCCNIIVIVLKINLGLLCFNISIQSYSKLHVGCKDVTSREEAPLLVIDRSLNQPHISQNPATRLAERKTDVDAAII